LFKSLNDSVLSLNPKSLTGKNRIGSIDRDRTFRDFKLTCPVSVLAGL
jgi:hypothetical protein